MFYVYLFISYHIIHLISIAKCDDKIEVTTKSGKIIGREICDSDGCLYRFLGIPYALPPVNQLRFKKPVPIKPWKESFDANEVPNACFQIKYKFPFVINANKSEDCLYLSIFTPKGDFNSLKPVMIYIHGGAFILGYSLNLDAINPIKALRNDIIIASLNYRLGTFGFLYAENKKNDAPGNAGLYDQLLAIKWIRDNIEAFGGDPKQITLFGESAGAMAVTLHIISPLSRNLFNYSLLMGGAALTHMTGANPSEASNNWVKAAKIAGCGNGMYFRDSTINCLRKLEPEKLAKIAVLEELKDYYRFIGSIPLIIYGDEFLPKKPIDMLKSGNFNKNIVVFAGNVNDEGSILVTNVFDPKFFNSDDPITFEDAKRELKSMVNHMKLKRPINADDVAKLYFTGIPHNDSARLRYAMANLIGDFVFVCPSVLFLKLIHSRAEHSSRVYQYYFAQRFSPVLKSFEKVPQWVVNDPTLDNGYFLGLPLVFPFLYEDTDQTLSSSMANDLLHFGRFGKLPAQNGIEWSNWFTLNGNIITPYFEYNSIQYNTGNFGFDFKHRECDLFWNKYIESDQ